MKFKIGDKVKILSSATDVGVEEEDVGKVGTISFISDDISKWFGFEVQMPEVCKARGYIPVWSVGAGMIELARKPNEQLLFSFMTP